MATSSTESVIKYRPYLSLAEIDAILSAIDYLLANYNNPCDVVEQESARMALLKTKTLAELGLQGVAYKTNPRPTLVDKLGFGVSFEEKQALLPPTNFDTMMAELQQIPTQQQTDGEST